MNRINGPLATFVFELTRSFTLHRLMVALGLALFPPLVVFLAVNIAFVKGNAISGDVLRFMEFSIVGLVALVCLLMLLLWATPNVHSELEGKTWSFVVIRPGGRSSCFFGKYFVSVFVSFVTVWVSLVACLLVAQRFNGFEDPLLWLLKISTVFFLACVGYGAIFSLLGTIFVKRAMVMGAGFLIVVDGFLASLPAVVSKLALSYHLREIGFHWLGWFVPFMPESDYRLQFGQAWPVWWHLVCVLLMMVIALWAGALVINGQQYVSAEE